MPCRMAHQLNDRNRGKLTHKRQAHCAPPSSVERIQRQPLRLTQLIFQISAIAVGRFRTLQIPQALAETRGPQQALKRARPHALRVCGQR